MRRVLVVSALCVGCALGQTTPVGQKQIVVQMGDAAELGPVGISTALAGPMGTVTGAPYSGHDDATRASAGGWEPN